MELLACQNPPKRFRHTSDIPWHELPVSGKESRKLPDVVDDGGLGTYPLALGAIQLRDAVEAIDLPLTFNQRRGT